MDQVDVLPALKDGASTAVFPSPIEGSGSTWVGLVAWASSPARPTPIHPRRERRGLPAFFWGQLEKAGNDENKGKRALELAEVLSSGQVTLTIEPGSRQFLTPPAVPESESVKKAIELIVKAVTDAVKDK